jgi:hypothetical protein
VAVPVDRHITQKEAEIKLQYKRLHTNVQQMWEMKCMIIPVIKGATRRVTNGLKKNWKPCKENIQ